MEQMNAGKKSHVIKVTGRLADIEAFMQILADILNVRLERSEMIGAVQGIALLTALCCEGRDFSSCNLAGNANQARTFYPRGVFSNMYDKKYDLYVKIYRSLKLIYE
jgi:sugar (pentulose or hexulose) kinase